MSKIFSNQNPIIDLTSVDPNNIIEMSFNFELLKYVLSVLINNQQNMNNEISNIKSELIHQQEKSGNLELELIELKLQRADSPEALDELYKKKKELDSKNKELKTELDSFRKLNESNTSKKKMEIYNMKQLPIYETKKNVYENELSSDLSNNINKNELNKTKEKDKESNVKKESQHISLKKVPIMEDIESKTMLDDMNKNMELLTADINNIKSTISTLQKDLSSFRNNTSEKFKENMEKKVPIMIEEALENKLTGVKKKINSDLTIVKDNINNVNKENEEKISKLDKDIKNIQSLLDEKYLKDLEIIKSNYQKIKNNLSQNSERLSNAITPLVFANSRREIEQKIEIEKKSLNIEILDLKSAISSIKNQLIDHLNDSRDRDNIVNMMRLIETMTGNINRLNDFKKILEEKEKRKAIVDNNKYIKPEQFNEGINNLKKMIEAYKKDFSEIRFDISSIKEDDLSSKASLKDLKGLEDVILNKMNKLKETIKENFVEKNMLVKNLKYIEYQTKNLIEENKKTEKQDNWLLAKKPFGHLCASCEAYIGDLKPVTNSNFISWNRYPQKNNNNTANSDILEKKIFKINAGFSKVLQMVNQDNNKDERSKSNSVNKSQEKRNSFSAEKDNSSKRKIPSLNILKKKRNLVPSNSFVGIGTGIEEYEKVKSLPTITVKHKNRVASQGKYNPIKSSINNISLVKRDEFYENMKDTEEIQQNLNEKPKITKIYKKRAESSEKARTDNKV